MENKKIRFKVNDLIVSEYINDNCHSIVLDVDESYKPIINYRDELIEKFNFNLLSEYGITDMVQNFEYDNVKFELKYNSNEDMILFDVYTNDEKILDKYRKIAVYFIAQKKNDMNYRKL